MMINKNVIALIACSLMSGPAFSQYDDDTDRESRTTPEVRAVYDRSEYQPHIGLTGGVLNPRESTDNSGEIGIDIGYQPFVPFGLGLEATHSRYSLNESVDDFDRTSILAKATYHFGGARTVIRNSYVGVVAGGIIRSDTDDSEFAGGPLVGFDIPLSNNSDMRASKFTLGANAKYLFTEAQEDEVAAVNGVLKYWF